MAAPVVLIGCYAPINRFTRNGFILRKILCAPGSLRIRKIGHIDSGSMMINRRASASIAGLLVRQAERLPYKLISSLG
jgi:hypothetical protein